VYWELLLMLMKSRLEKYLKSVRFIRTEAKIASLVEIRNGCERILITQGS
jgi:predicted membrane chloride channel (bestrophin family)